MLNRTIPASDLARLAGVTRRTVRKARQGCIPALQRWLDATEGREFNGLDELENAYLQKLRIQACRKALYDTYGKMSKLMEKLEVLKDSRMLAKTQENDELYSERNKEVIVASKELNLLYREFQTLRNQAKQYGIWWKDPDSIKKLQAEMLKKKKERRGKKDRKSEVENPSEKQLLNT